MAITVVAADPHPTFLLGLERLLSSESDIDLLACCTTAEEVRLEIGRLKPDLLTLDLDLTDGNGLELLSELMNSTQPIKIVILTAVMDNDQAIASLRLGVQGVVLKSMPPHLVVQCIRKVAAGGLWMEKQSIGQAFEKMLRREAGARRLANILTSRETEVMCLVAQGLSNRKIAEDLFVCEGTVKMHIHNIYGKLGINNRVDLTLYAQKRGLV